MLGSHRLPLPAFVLALVLATGTSLRANDIQINNATLVSNNTAGGYAMVQFDLSWENSWRTDNLNGDGVTNWDAAWVFVKVYDGGAWHHAWLNNTGHTAPSGSNLDVGLRAPVNPFNTTSNPGLGAFLYRSTNGTGALPLSGVQLRWNYGAQGFSYSNIKEIKVFAIEMVYVPQGPFAVGAATATGDQFQLTTINTSQANLQASGNGGLLGSPQGGYPVDFFNPPASFWPNGYNAFYSVKYEVSQQGYVDFLNTLTYTQQVTRTVSPPNSAPGTGALTSGNNARNGIDIQSPGVANTTPAVYACNLNGNTTYGEASDGADVACNYIGGDNLLAYLDWAALRPMTELEYEKSCRGGVAPVEGEYPWGGPTITSDPYQLSSSGEANEAVSVNYGASVGNAHYADTDGTIDGPTRVGVLSDNPLNTGRATSGAGYYGCMDLGGNVEEYTVAIDRTVNIETLTYQGGGTYTGGHGDGVLTADGDSNLASWPSAGTISMRKGGSYASNSDRLQVAYRSYSGAGGGSNNGGRGVRSAP